MQDTPIIEVTPRERTGTRYAQRLRKTGRLPAVVYGHKVDPIHVSVDEKEILMHLHQGAHVVGLNIDGGKTETCLVKDLQFGYLGDNVIHIDFTRVNLDEEVTVQVRLNFVGQPHLAQQSNAILNHVLTELEVVCRVRDIPEDIKVDQTEMGNTLTVGEIVLPPALRCEIDPGEPVATISFIHKEEAVGEEVEIDVEEGGEPVVITETKADEGDGKKKADSE